MRLLLALLSAASALAVPAPGLLRVPRVYNALVTSNQNLSPSRAFPVIQPVVHTTAVGYVPPFYYTQFAPSYPGPEVGRLPQEFLPAEGAGTAKVAPGESLARSAADHGEKVTPPGKDDPGRKEAAEAPLSFYPSYQSLYYDPFLYSYNYNAFDARLAPSPYLFDYRPRPQAPPPSRGGYEDRRRPVEPQLPRADAGNSGSIPAEEKIPDVPPPPVPTSSSNKSS